MSKKKSVLLRSIIAFIIAAIFFYIVMQQVKLDKVVEAFKGISVVSLSLATLLYFLSHVFRAKRIYDYFENISFKHIFNVSCLHNFFNNVLPVRMGEISYLLLMKRAGVKTSKGIVSLGLIRYLDIMMIFIFFAVSLMIVNPGIGSLAVFLNTFGIVILIITFGAVFGRRYISSFLKRCKPKRKLIDGLRRKLIESLEELDSIERKKIIYLIINSFIVWFFMMLTAYSIFILVLDISFFLVVIGTTLVMLTYVLPIQGFLGFGTTEGMWTFAVVSFGYSVQDAIVSGLVYHLILVCFITVLGLYGLIAYRKMESIPAHS